MAASVEIIADHLRKRGETLAICETAAGGLVTAACLTLPGASAWCLGGAVAYSRGSRHALLQLDASIVAGLEPMSEAMALAFARHTRRHLGSDWALAELGIAGPDASPYGGPAGVAVIAVAGARQATQRLSTGHDRRSDNMRAFAEGALELLATTLSAQP